MNKRIAKQIEKEANDRVRMKNALTAHGHTLRGDETTEKLEELVIVTFAPPVPQFEGVVSRAMSEILTEQSA